MEQENNQPMEAPQSPEPTGEVHKQGNAGALVALGVIVLIIILGALYIFGDRVGIMQKDEDELEAQFQMTQEERDARIEASAMQGDSTGLSSIEADLEATDFSDFDSEREAMDQEFGY